LPASRLAVLPWPPRRSVHEGSTTDAGWRLVCGRSAADVPMRLKTNHHVDRCTDAVSDNPENGA
jgi:hypothetical protein